MTHSVSTCQIPRKLSIWIINLRGGMPPLEEAFQAHFVDGWNSTTGNVGKTCFWMIEKIDHPPAFGVYYNIRRWPFITFVGSKSGWDRPTVALWRLRRANSTYFLLTIRNPRLNITYGVGTRHFVGIACVPNLSLSHYRKMVLNVVRVSDWAAETPLKIESRFVATSESTILKPNLLL